MATGEHYISRSSHSTVTVETYAGVTLQRDIVRRKRLSFALLWVGAFYLPFFYTTELGIVLEVASGAAVKQQFTPTLECSGYVSASMKKQTGTIVPSLDVDSDASLNIILTQPTAATIKFPSSSESLQVSV